MYQIDKGVPVPSNTIGRPKHLPFNTMEVGDSFAAPNRVSVAAQNTNGKQFLVRKVTENGVTQFRVWRVA